MSNGEDSRRERGENAQNVPREDQANVQAMAYWDRVIEDMEATAAEFADAGWETLELHPGDVHVLSESEDPGLDLLIGDDEFETLEELFESGLSLTETEVLRASTEGMQYVVTVSKDPEMEWTILTPLYYRIADPDVGTMFDRARTSGQICIRLRTLTGDYIDVHHDDLSLFEPDDE
jgi:hypothetical protein